MDALRPATLVHFYDTRRHEVLCGLRGVEHRSTKHSRHVTCHKCIGLLAERPTALASSASADAQTSSAL
jgi:hypothetical protein